MRVKSLDMDLRVFELMPDDNAIHLITSPKRQLLRYTVNIVKIHDDNNGNVIVVNDFRTTA